MMWLGFVLYSMEAHGQDKWFVTPNRGGGEGAKANAIIHTLINENIVRRIETTANAASITIFREAVDASITQLRTATDASFTVIDACGAGGMIYGKGHAAADAGDCIPSFQIASDGLVQFQGGAKLGHYALCEPATAGALRYNAAAKRVEFCNGNLWGMLGGNSGCAINFPPITNAELSTFYDTTDAVYSAESGTASVSGATTATVRRNGANTGASSGVTINQGNSVGIRGRSSSQFSQTVNFTLDIDAYTACWQITTKQQDVTPNSFTFTNATDQDLNALVTSNSVTVTDFDGPLAVSITGQGNPQLKIGSGGWVSSGNIEPGQSLTLRLTSSADFMTAHAATVTLGSHTAAWSVTTRSNDCTSIGQSLHGGKCAQTGPNALIAASSDLAGGWAWSWHAASSACTAIGTGWYLPSLAETEVLFQNRVAIGGFPTFGVANEDGWYWSSTTSTNPGAWARGFWGPGHGLSGAAGFMYDFQTTSGGSTNARARCVRRAP